MIGLLSLIVGALSFGRGDSGGALLCSLLFVFWIAASIGAPRYRRRRYQKARHAREYAIKLL